MTKATRETVERARVFATAAHAAVGQVRKYTYEPYIVHPAEVASIVESVEGATFEMICAAWLHDTVEDTDVSIDVIREEFGDEVAEIVGWLTDVSKPEDGNRAARKAIDRAHSAMAPAEAQTVKLADLISNSSSITRHDANFAKTYLEEKRMLLAVMDKGDATLMAHARKYIGE
jgi:guanosine-3',5'-bis(diphosphate) 3'-pyrophosphohydrolase